jgi:hypothetical protein
MLNNIKKFFAKPEEAKPESKKQNRKEPVLDTELAEQETIKKQPRSKKEEKVLSEKEKATNAGEPYIAITKVEINPNNINDGAFELDWNDKFVINLIKAGYKFKDTDTDAEIVDRWFQMVCRNIALEMYEQLNADPSNRDPNIRPIQSRDLGNGRTEVS